MLVPWTFRPLPWSMYSRCPQVAVPFLQPPPTPKFALAPFDVVGLMMNPPPVRKSHIQAFAAPLASVRASVAIPSARRVQIARMIIPPLLNGRGGGPEDHVCYTVDDKMQGVHDDAARGGRLLVDHELAPRKGDRLVRSAAHVDGHAVEREIAEHRAGGPVDRLRRAAASNRKGRKGELRGAGHGPRQQAGHEHGGTAGGSQERIRVTHFVSLGWDERCHQTRRALRAYTAPFGPFGVSR